jgi:NAD(P)-dependent dehydrogenase (short-subunit alcohol dehydrogenase family)
VLDGLEGLVGVVTGAGRGLGRAEALELARHGVRLVVNDFGRSLHGEKEDNPADTLVAEITENGGEAVANYGDVADWNDSQALVQQAVDTYGGLDVLVNNAGIIRDRTIFNMSEEEWDSVIRTHLKGHFCMSRHATAYWRERAKSSEGEQTYGRIINTSSEAFLSGPPGQPNYSAAKAGITALTLSTAQGLARYGVRANAICPRARTAMTAAVFGDAPETGGLDVLSPDRVATFVSYLASPAADEITGQVFVVYGDMVALLAPPTVEQKFTAADGVFSVDEFDALLTPYFSGRDPHRTYAAHSVARLGGTQPT